MFCLLDYSLELKLLLHAAMSVDFEAPLVAHLVNFFGSSKVQHAVRSGGSDLNCIFTRWWAGMRRPSLEAPVHIEHVDCQDR